MIQSPGACVSICIRITLIVCSYVKLFKYDVITIWKYFHLNCRRPLWKKIKICIDSFIFNKSRNILLNMQEKWYERQLL